ncbi:MAG: hypothetical protein ACOZAM_14995 [Pseudomonadota bacterium]
MDRVIEEIAAERRRQIEGEGWTTEHDDAHEGGELARAAACYAAGSTLPMMPFRPGKRVRGYSIWPWDLEWWKPKSKRQDLIRAAALLVAEIERLDRAAVPHP